MEEPLKGYFTRALVEKVAAVLRDGGVAVLPTDTIYGLHCAASNIGAVERIRGIKGRREKTGFILLASDMDMAGRLVMRWPRGARELLARIWPAPLTAVLPASNGVDSTLAPKGTVALRIPANPWLRRCIELSGGPLVSTSVNRSGRMPMTRMGEIRREVPGLEAYVSRRGRPGARPSTIVDMTAEPPRIIRLGRHAWPLGRDRGDEPSGHR